jgi:hypothetical protein
MQQSRVGVFFALSRQEVFWSFVSAKSTDWHSVPRHDGGIPLPILEEKDPNDMLF